MELQDVLKPELERIVKGLIKKPVYQFDTKRTKKGVFSIQPESGWLSVPNSGLMLGLHDVPSAYTVDVFGDDVELVKIFKAKETVPKIGYKSYPSTEHNHGFMFAQKFYLVSNSYGDLYLHDRHVWVGYKQVITPSLGGLIKWTDMIGIVDNDFGGVPIEGQDLFARYVEQENKDYRMNNTPYFAGNFENE